MNSDKCRLCGSEWGNYREIIAEMEEKFCCQICATQYRNLIDRILKENIGKVKSISIPHNKGHRIVTIELNHNRSIHYKIRFNSGGDLTFVKKLD